MWARIFGSSAVPEGSQGLSELYPSPNCERHRERSLRVKAPETLPGREPSAYWPSPTTWGRRWSQSPGVYPLPPRTSRANRDNPPNGGDPASPQHNLPWEADSVSQEDFVPKSMT